MEVLVCQNRRNDLKSPFGIETRNLSILAHVGQRRNDLKSPFGIETHYIPPRSSADFQGRNDLKSPFGIETFSIARPDELDFRRNDLKSPFGIETRKEEISNMAKNVSE